MKKRRIAFATDFSPASERAREAALQLAKKLDADLTVLHVLEPPPYPYPISLPESVRSAVEDQLDRVAAELRRAGARAERLLLEGAPAAEIVAFAEREKLDFVVLGTHGHRGVTHLLLGSVAERVVRLSPVPVLTVPAWRYADRAAAGRELAGSLLALRDQRPLVLALSLGAIPIAREVANALDASLDALFVREVACDGQTAGAVAEDGTLLADDRAISRHRISIKALGDAANAARNLNRDDSIRVRGARWIGDISDRTVVLVSDALATEWTAAVAAKLLRGMGARRIVAAAPAIVAPAGEALTHHADEVRCVDGMGDLTALHFLYRDGREPSRREASELLSALTPP